MKARIPPKIPKQLKQEAERIAKSAYEQFGKGERLKGEFKWQKTYLNV